MLATTWSRTLGMPRPPRGLADTKNTGSHVYCTRLEGFHEQNGLDHDPIRVPGGIAPASANTDGLDADSAHPS